VPVPVSPSVDVLSPPRRLRADEVARRSRLANGAERVEVYSLARRLRRVEEPDGSTLSFRYDAEGHITEAAQSTGERANYRTEASRLEARLGRTETVIDLNEDGLPARVTQRMDGHEWVVEYRQDDRGQVNAIRYPQSSDWVTFRASREGSQIITRIGWPGRTLAEARFDGRLQRTQVICANGATMGEQLSNGRLTRVQHQGRSGNAVELNYEHDDQQRITRAGLDTFTYDERGRLASWNGLPYEYEAQEPLPAPAPIPVESNTVSYDAIGRRERKGEATYGYNLYGQLDRVQLPDGERIRYHYDGFGRLVAREARDGIRYYIVGFDGQRLAEADAQGKVTRRYLWMAQNCIAHFDLAGEVTSLHRIHGSRLAAIGDPNGKLRAVALGDPYGHGAHIEEGLPGYASLFGDPRTGLWLAGSRWLDASTAQFLTPDTWFGTDAWNHLPRDMRRVLDRLPGGTDFGNDPVSAYCWCDYDPINRSDPNGHNPLGLFWSVISSFFWQMQVTSVALQMEVINIIANIVLLPLSFLYWDFYKKISIFNAIPPLLASYRLMVPYAFPLNGIYTAGDGVFTMGAVIWARGDQLRNLEDTSQRDILIAPNAQDYKAAIDAAAASTFTVRNRKTNSTATVDNAGVRLSAVTLSPAAGGATVPQTFEFPDWVAVRLPGGEDQFRRISSGVAASSFDVDPPLPAAMRNQNVEVVRLDSGIVRLNIDTRNICRTTTFVRGTAIHYARQIPEAFPASGLTATEYLPAVRRDFVTGANFHSESIVVQLAAATDLADFAADDFVSIRKGSTYHGRRVVRTHGTVNLVLDTPLPQLAAPDAYDPVEIIKMDGGATVNNQSASGDMVDCGNLTALRKFDGLAITSGGTTDRRIVIGLFVRCPIAALPATLHGADLAVEVVVPGAVAGAGVTNATTLTTTAGQGSRLKKDRPVRVRAGADEFLTTIANIAGDTITLAEALPAAFAAGTNVTATDLAMSRALNGDPSAAPGDQVLVTVDDPAQPVQTDLLFIRPRGSATGGVVRTIAAATTVVAKVDSNPSNAANLDVQRFTSDASTLHIDAKATPVVLRLTTGGAAPYAAGDELYLTDNLEEAYGKVQSVNASEVILEDPIAVPTLSASGDVQRIEPTGITTNGAELGESLIMIPSAMDDELVDRRRAVELHEMRHVWQYSVLGPFFFSQPIPWLLHLGFAISGEGAGHASHNLTKWISLGLVDKLFSAVAWGIGAAAGVAPQDAEGNGVLNGKVITFDDSFGNMDAFSGDDPIEVTPDQGETLFNIIESVNAGARQLTLRFSLDGVADGTRVKAAVSAFNTIDRTVNKYFSLNLERLWSDHIPTAWGRALSGLLNRENWFPLLGFYPLSLAAAGFDQSRVNFEQDASFESGDLYNPFTISSPNEIFVGQFSRVHAFIYGRGAGDTGVGLSTLRDRLIDSLTVEPPTPPAGRTAADMVAGSVDSALQAGQVHFRENWMIPMKSKAANVLGALFAASVPGSYRLHTPGELDRLQRMLFFSADFFELRTITVKPLVITPALGSPHALFETEEITLNITGDPAAVYSIRYKGAAPANAGVISGMKFSAPVLAAGAAPEVHELEIVATYAADAAVFNGPGQEGAIRLTEAQRSNVCQDVTLRVSPLVVPPIGPVSAGGRATFQMPFPPIAAPTVTSLLPAGATVNASVTNGTGRPATLTFHAPDRIDAAVDVTFDMLYRVAPEKKLTATVRVIKGIEAEVTIDGVYPNGKNYIAWAPTRAHIRIREAAGATGPVAIRLENRTPASGGQVIFYENYTPGARGTDTLTLNVNADGTTVDFHIAGKFGRPSQNEDDTVIQVVATATGAVIAQKTLMIRIRKNAEALTDAERDRFVAAYARANAQNDAVFSYGAFRDIHRDAGSDEAHGDMGFLPWHRAYVLDLEREIQKHDPSVTMPYWRFDQPAPKLFHPNFLGVPFAAGNPMTGWTTEGFTGVDRTPEFNPATESAHGTTPGDAPVIDEAATFALGSPGKRFANFTRMENNPHGAAHISFTGFIDTIDTAVRDPLFFLLHCNVDRLWAKWQLPPDSRINANAADPAERDATYPTAPTRIGHNLNDTMWPWNGVTGSGAPGERPPSAPGGALSGTPAAVAQVPVPRVLDMIDFQGVINLASQLGFGYDDVPFET
jgi:tyrosinase